MVAISVSQQVRETLSQLQAVTIFISRPWKCTKILKITFWVSVTSSLEKAFKRQFQMQRRTSTIKPWKLQGGRLFSLKLYLITKNDIVADNFNCCLASAGSRLYSWSIWDFWFDGSMVRCRGGKRRGLGPRNDVLTTCKAVTLRGGQRIIALFPTVNIFRLFRSRKRTDRGNQKCLKNWKTWYHASLFSLHIVFVFRYWNCGGN